MLESSNVVLFSLHCFNVSVVPWANEKISYHIHNHINVNVIGCSDVQTNVVGWK